MMALKQHVPRLVRLPGRARITREHTLAHLRGIAGVRLHGIAGARLRGIAGTRLRGIAGARLHVRMRVLGWTP
eukprot:6987238-Alexandrium_andersonii.AAC.1